MHGVQQGEVIQVPNADVLVVAARDQDIASSGHQDPSHRPAVMGDAMSLKGKDTH